MQIDGLTRPLCVSQDGPIADVAWAPPRGRSSDVVAVSTRANVLLWEIHSGPDGLHTTPVAQLQHAAPVRQAQWDALGSWLAASTESGDICLWRPDLGGEWLRLSHVHGERAVVA